MEQSLEIYVRPGSEHNMLNLHVPSALKDQFLKALAKGTFELPASAINFEINVLPEWLTDPTQRRIAERAPESMHVRVPLKAINIHFNHE